MIARARAWWLIRTPRERWLLGVLAALATLMLGWFAVVRPLDLLLVEARTAHAAALDAEAAARMRVARLTALRGAAQSPLSAPLASFVQDAATQAGFSGVTVTPEGAGRVRATMPTARPQAVFSWLERLRLQGVIVQAATLRPAQGSTVSVELVLSSGRAG